jgi:hypothetical protein
MRTQWRNTNGYANRHADCNSDRDSNGHTDCPAGDSDRYTNRNAHGHTDCPTGHSDSQPNFNSDKYAYSHTFWAHCPV